MAKQKLTKNQLEYKRQMKRIRQALYRERKKGFDVREVANVLLEKPSRITKSFIDKLRSITPSVIRKKSQYIQYVPPKGTPLIDRQPYIDKEINEVVSTDFGDFVERRSLYTGELIEAYPLNYSEYERLRDEYDQKYDQQYRERETTSYEEPINETVEQEQQIFAEQPTDNKGYYTRSGGEYIIFDENGEAVDKIELVNGEYISVETGEIYGTAEELAEKLSDTPYESNGWEDLTDYAIEQLYEQTAAISKNTNGVFHNMFDAIRERIGDSAFYDSLMATNGYRSFFETFQRMIHSGGSYPQEFMRFGVSVANTLPVTPEERTQLENAFAEIIEAEYGAEMYEV